jgi:hypothetical protein
MARFEPGAGAKELMLTFLNSIFFIFNNNFLVIYTIFIHLETP